MQKGQCQLLVAVPFHIHCETGLIIFRLQMDSDKFRKMLFKIFDLIAGQGQTRCLAVAAELDQVGGTGVYGIIHVQRRNTAAGALGHIAADTDQDDRTVVFVHQSGSDDTDHAGMPACLGVRIPLSRQHNGRAD